MKKLLLLSALFVSCLAKGQIVFEHQYDSASTYGVRDSTNSDLICQLMIVKFEVSGERYVKINRIGKSIEIFDLNHSLLKTISIANFPQGCNQTPSILYLSEKLFDTDPLMEFMYIYGDCAATAHTRIYKENGTCIFSIDDYAPWILLNIHLQQYPIYNTTQGTKMILSNDIDTQGDARVYSLPGTLTMGIDDGNKQLIQNNLISNPYPNPNKNYTSIDYQLPDGENTGEIVFYDLAGNEVKRFKVDRTFTSLHLSTADLAPGTYYYQLQTSKQSSQGKKMVVIK